MRKYSILISILTLIFGFTFYSDTVSITIYDTNYIIAAEVICFAIWLIFMIVFQLINLKRYFSRNEA
ncbi:hypothetical protein [Christiangramia crocea]|uniref:Uncharacterized protein n=1 Tax=Christiangramia crocea TaxID=2904124 RepID=A0A9X1UUP9_9FLAO|nr:hypothetical protein [Gramella crocea]MCG9970717.1 hypothetical protein [Gramella crocea]